MLWKKAYNRAVAASVMIDLHLYLTTKISYFGKQLINKKNVSMNSYLKHRKNAAFFIINPTSTIKGLWNIVIIFFLVYTGFITPYRTSFATNIELETLNIFYYLEIIIDYVFGLDILINFISAYERLDGETEYKFKRIALNYLTGFFWIDFLSTFPFNLIIDSE